MLDIGDCVRCVDVSLIKFADIFPKFWPASWIIERHLLNEHQRLKNRAPRLSNRSFTLYVLICDKLFSQNQKLKTHMRNHIEKKFHECLLCARCFIHYNSNLIRYLKSHLTDHMNRMRLVPIQSFVYKLWKLR